MLESARVWDRITRLWHWAFALSVVTGWLLGEFRDFETVQWHFYAGYVTGGLLLWRLIWGFIGPEPIRFSTLFASVKHTPAYMSRVMLRQPSGIVGHTPPGAVSIILMLVLLTFQAVSGLFIEDDTLFAAGPLAYDIDSDLGKRLKSLHSLNAKFILAVVAVHLAAILFYRFWKREDLIKPMFTGKKWVYRR